MMGYIKQVAILLLLVLAMPFTRLSAQDGAEPDRLVKNRKIYLKAIQKIEAEHLADLKNAIEAYLKRLEMAKSYYAKKGDFDRSWLLKEELERVQAILKKGDEGVQEILQGAQKK